MDRCLSQRITMGRHSWSLRSLALGLRVEVLPEVRILTVFSGSLEFSATKSLLTLSLSLPLCQTGLVHLLSPPQQLLAGLDRGRQTPAPRRPVFPLGRSCPAGPVRRPPACPATLTTVLVANANISAARPRTQSPRLPTDWAKSAPPPTPPVGPC